MGYTRIMAALLAVLVAAAGQEVASQRAKPSPPAAAAVEPPALPHASQHTPTGQAGPPTDPAAAAALLKRYCQGCHNGRVLAGRLALDTLDVAAVGTEAAAWEKVVRKLRAGVMPPAGMPRPDEPALDRFVSYLETALDAAAAAHPNPGRTEALHRLNRTEYRHAIRDLLALDIDVADFLPADSASYGFDNIAGALTVSQSLLERYLAAARTISRLAVGSPLPAVDAATYRLSPSLPQHERVEALPFGTRGGTLISHFFPLNGEYDLRVEVSGASRLRETHELEITLDARPVKRFTLAPRGAGGADDAGKLAVRLPIDAGPREVGVTFIKKPTALVEGLREPLPNPRFDGGPGGPLPTVASVTITGPFDPAGPGDTPSRRRIFVCQPAGADEEAPCARRILAGLSRRAYRGLGPASAVDELMAFYRETRDEGGSFEAGVEAALRSLLMSPHFLFRIAIDPAADLRASRAPGADDRDARVYRLSDLELASRLSFFLWSSIPDEELLAAAERGALRDAAVLERQVRRMLADPRSEALTTSFAGQWLQLRNLDMQRPGDPYSLAFDEALRQGLRRETELLFDSAVREDRSVLELLTADYTFLNERVALHYGIPHVQGSHFRRVALPADSPRRGLLGHGSILTLTSHAIRTSPVLRGKWLLNTVLGTPPPDPPPNVPALADERTQARVQTIRERMAQHRANPSCAACHSLIDPAGFALENFDAIGRWRTVDESFNPIDTTGALPDGTTFDGVAELRAALVRRPERFVTTAVERLLTYALGRGLEHDDMPTVRGIVRAAAADGFRFQAVLLGIVRSYPFQMRSLDPPPAAEPDRRQADAGPARGQ